ncbi:MAG: glycosyltransferase family 9 protein [Campylobacterota bacterium]|nr:glycosyltransferase family 9 protein [Campylobacterota bacterium]
MTILITRHDKIGDFITALPMCKVLKEQTNHKIVMMVSKVNVDLAKKFDFIDDVIEYSDDSFTLLNRINNVKPDVSISGYIDFHLGLCLFLAKIPRRIAPATKIAQIFFNNKIKQRRSEVKKTEWEYNLDLLKQFDKTLQLEFKKPLLTLDNKKEDFIIFHTGFGGSSDGNLTLDDYLKLAKQASQKVKVVFTFGPDDDESKKYIKEHLDFHADIRDDFKSLWEFTQFISTSKLFISTSTGPMHLAGLTNTSTFSFFGENLFASSKRWATISDKKLQHNYEVPANYTNEFYDKIENKLMEII